MYGDKADARTVRHKNTRNSWQLDNQWTTKQLQLKKCYSGKEGPDVQSENFCSCSSPEKRPKGNDALRDKALNPDECACQQKTWIIHLKAQSENYCSPQTIFIQQHKKRTRREEGLGDRAMKPMNVATNRKFGQIISKAPLDWNHPEIRK